MQENIRSVTNKQQIDDDIENKVIEVEKKIIQLKEQVKILNEQYMLSEKYATERNYYTKEIAELRKLSFSFDKELIMLNIDESTIKLLELTAERLKIEIHQLTIANSLWQSYTNELNELNKKIDSLALDYTLNNRLNTSKEEVELLKKKIENHELVVLCNKKFEYIDNFRFKCLNVKTLLTDLYELQKQCLTVERECLEGTVSQINTDLSNMCSTIFDSDIEVLLDLYKLLKSDKEKECVNVHILNKGVKYDFKELSGGQASRVSLALTIALSLTSNSPILILDEAFSSLDATSREKCLKIVKYNTRKTVIMVSHMEIQGVYDHVINL